MLSSVQLRQTIEDLDAMHTDHLADITHKSYYAKLALIELCGWIEECVDEMAYMFCVGVGDRDKVEKLIKSVHGFTYESHIKVIIIRTVGIQEWIRIEDSLRAGPYYELMRVKLDALNLERNRAAHRFIDGVQATFSAPSTTLRDLNEIEPALKELERLVFDM